MRFATQSNALRRLGRGDAKSTNDAGRRRIYLARFDLDWPTRTAWPADRAPIWLQSAHSSCTQASVPSRKLLKYLYGWVAERFKAPVLKTAGSHHRQYHAIPNRTEI